MSANMRGFRGKNLSDSKTSDRSEDVGNRKTYDELRVPPDNLGNKTDYDSVQFMVHDNVGNSLEDEPSHLKSGILTCILEDNKKTSRIRRESASNKIGRDNDRTRLLSSSHGPKKVEPVYASAEQYMRLLAEEFKKLLYTKAGIPFSFSMNAIGDGFDEAIEQANLLAVKELIESTLRTTEIEASVSLQEYGADLYRFAVFFVAPSDHDPLKNKILISALRQVVSLYINQYSTRKINIFLVLANAQTVIESHLTKIGAKKI